MKGFVFQDGFSCSCWQTQNTDAFTCSGVFLCSSPPLASRWISEQHISAWNTVFLLVAKTEQLIPSQRSNCRRGESEEPSSLLSETWPNMIMTSLALSASITRLVEATAGRGRQLPALRSPLIRRKRLLRVQFVLLSVTGSDEGPQNLQVLWDPEAQGPGL